MSSKVTLQAGYVPSDKIARYDRSMCTIIVIYCLAGIFVVEAFGNFVVGDEVEDYITNVETTNIPVRQYIIFLSCGQKM